MTNHSFTCQIIRIIIASSDRNNPDRSIPTRTTVRAGVGIEAKFQSYQSKQINPDFSGSHMAGIATGKFQSYQSKQINPYKKKSSTEVDMTGRFQSYQSKQINPDLICI